LQQLESPQQPRGLVVVRKPDRKPSRVDKLYLWLSKSQTIDGLWIGKESGPHAALHRVEDAVDCANGGDTEQRPCRVIKPEPLRQHIARHFSGFEVTARISSTALSSP
jgi:hypothetical protein